MHKNTIKHHSVMKAFLLFWITSISTLNLVKAQDNSRFISLIVDPKTTDIELFWKNDQNEIINNFQNLKSYVENKGKHLHEPYCIFLTLIEKRIPVKLNLITLLNINIIR